jgi:hypothetical protein
MGFFSLICSGKYILQDIFCQIYCFGIIFLGIIFWNTKFFIKLGMFFFFMTSPPDNDYQRIPKGRVSFKGIGEKYKIEVYGDRRTGYKPVKSYKSKPYIYFSPDLIRVLNLKRGVNIKTFEQAKDIVFGSLFFQLREPKFTRVRLFHKDVNERWNLNRRWLRLYFTVWYYYNVSIEEYVEKDIPFPIPSTIHFMFSYRTSYNWAVRQKFLKFYFDIISKYLQNYYTPEGNIRGLPRIVPIGLHLGIVDVGHRTAHKGFSLREMKRLVEFDIFNKVSLRKSHAKLRGMV